jgi:hypothetical protein
MNFYGDLDAAISLADVRARRMRCYGHILNLVARAFLYGEDSEAFEAESQVFDLLGRWEDDLQHWRKKGPVGNSTISSSSSGLPLRAFQKDYTRERRIIKISLGK